MYLLFALSIITSSFLFIIFKYFEKYKVVTLNAIVINYIVAGGLSFLIQGEPISISKAIAAPWFELALILGFLFVSLFNLMAYSSQKIGIASTSIANKITFVVPTILWILFYHESNSWLKSTGIVLALLSILLTGEKSKSTSGKTSLLLLFGLFIGGGVLDTLLSYAQQELVPNGDTSIFFGYLFLFAFIFGLVFLLISKLQGKPWPSKKDFLWGAILGVPNYFSMYLFLRSLEGIPTSTAFPVANMGIILGSTFLSIILFKEQLSPKKTFALSLSIGAILLISFHEEIINLFNG